jgi:hypothetical protein
MSAMSLNAIVLEDSAVPLLAPLELPLDVSPDVPLDVPLLVAVAESFVNVDFIGGAMFLRLASSLFKIEASDLASESSRLRSSLSFSAVEVQPVKSKSKLLQINGIDFDIVSSSRSSTDPYKYFSD